MKDKLLVLDNYDSFTFNLVHLLGELGVRDMEVHRNDKISLDDVATYERIVLSPGPGIPLEAGIMPELVKRYAPHKKILGICLGHQCIGEVFGGELLNLSYPVHGKATPMKITEPGEPVFQGLQSEITIGRYHSWVVDRKGFPESLRITAVDDQGNVMALQHKQFAVTGLQFHPESVLTPDGRTMLKNWLE